MDSTPIVYFLIPGLQNDDNKVSYNDVNSVVSSYLNDYDKWMIRRTCKEARKLYKVGNKFIFGYLKYAIIIDSVEMLNDWDYYDPPEYNSTFTHLCYLSAKYGRLKCLIFLHKKGFGLNQEVCDVASLYGHFDCLKYLHENGCPFGWKSLTWAFEYAKNTYMSKYKKLGSFKHFMNDKTFINNCLKCFVYLIENDAYGSSKYIGWYNKIKHYFEPTPIAFLLLPDLQSDDNKVKYNDISKSIIEYLNPFDKWMFRQTCRTSRKYIRVGEKYNIFRNNIDLAILFNSVPMIKYYTKTQNDLDEYHCATASDMGHLECLKYLCESGCPWDSRTTIWAASSGELDCLKYACENGCPYNDITFYFAVENGHLDCVKYLHERKCSTGVDICTDAVSELQLECLKFLHENGYSWDESTFKEALLWGEKGHEILEYLIKEGCPGSEGYIITTKKRKCEG